MDGDKKMKRALLIALLLPLCLVPLFAQQQVVNRYDGFTGFSALTTPSLSLNEYGFNGSFGVNVKRWVGLGVDISAFTGNGIASISQTTTKTQATLVSDLTALQSSVPPAFLPQIAPLIPSCLSGPTHGLSCQVPFSVNTFTAAAGPQFNIRHWQYFTIFLRPALGLYHQSATLNLPQSAFGPLLGGVSQLSVAAGGAPVTSLPGIASSQSNNVLFAGAGAGTDFNLSKHVGFRFSFDWVNTHSFSNLLSARQNNYRISAGPQWKWGELKQK
jgi:hypothetical protein